MHSFISTDDTSALAYFAGLRALRVQAIRTVNAAEGSTAIDMSNMASRLSCSGIANTWNINQGRSSLCVLKIQATNSVTKVAFLSSLSLSLLKGARFFRVLALKEARE